MIRRLLIACVLAVPLAGGIAAEAAAADAQQRPQASSLRITVKDQSGAVVPGALVQIKGAVDKTAAVSMSDLASDRQGIVTAFELFVSGTNLLNTVNHIGYSGVMTSRFFAQPTAAMATRRIDIENGRWKMEKGTIPSSS